MHSTALGKMHVDTSNIKVKALPQGQAGPHGIIHSISFVLGSFIHSWKTEHSKLCKCVDLLAEGSCPAGSQGARWVTGNHYLTLRSGIALRNFSLHCTWAEGASIRTVLHGTGCIGMLDNAVC